jgi:hypothetical protein
MKVLAAGLKEPGYESFDVEEMKDCIFMTKRKGRRMKWEKLNHVEN